MNHFQVIMELFEEKNGGEIEWYLQGRYPAGTLTRAAAVMGSLPLRVRSISDLTEEAEFPRAAFKGNAVRAFSIKGLCRAQGLLKSDAFPNLPFL